MLNSISRESLCRLGELHTAGVVLRNRGKSKKFTTEDRPAWRKEYDEWKAAVVAILMEWHPGQAQRIQTVNRTPNYKFRRARWTIGKGHRTDLRTLERRLEILEAIMYDRDLQVK